MRKGIVFLWLLVFVMCGVAWAAPGDKNWEWSTGAGSTTAYYYSPYVAIDSQGNRIIGYSLLDSSHSSTYGHVVSLNQSGEVNWETDISDGSNDFEVGALVVDKDDNIIVGGTEYNGSDHDWKVVKLSSTGVKLKEFSYDNGDDYLLDVADDSQGRIVAVGETKDSTSGIYSGVVNFLSEGTVTLLTTSTNSAAGRVVFDKSDNAIILAQVENGGYYDWKVVAYSSSGTELWNVSFDGGYGSDFPSDLAVDANGNVAVVGRTKTAVGDYDWKVILYQVSGSSAAIKWADQIDGDGGDDIALSVAFDDIGNVVVGGSKTRGGDKNWLVISYDSSTGSRRWTAIYDSTMGNDSPLQIAVGSGMVVAVGLSSNGSDYDWRVRAYAASNGAVKWDDVCDSSGGWYDRANSVAIDSNGGAFVGGDCDNKEIKAVDYAGLTPPDGGGGSGGDSGGADNGTGGGSGGTDNGTGGGGSGGTDNGTSGGDNGTGGGGGTPLPGHVLKAAGESRTIDAPSADPNPIRGVYLGFGSAAMGGSTLTLKAAFPQYVDSQRSHVLNVKIYIAFTVPGYEEYLFLFNKDGGIAVYPIDSLASWKPLAKGRVSTTTLLTDIATSDLPSGTYYWLTFVVPSYISDDLSNWEEETPWELTLTELDLQ